jgi:uncharacterized membrane protein
MITLSSILAVPLSHPAKAYNTNDFTISSFNADYYLSRNDQKTSAVDVTENIKADFPSYDQNHGILRAIPKTYQGHTVSLKINSVKNESENNWKYSTSTQNDNLVLKIGDADRYVHGSQTFVISYSMKNVINILGDHEEFYWDVNGDQWPQTMANVHAKIHMPSDIAASLQDRQICYAGSYGSTRQDCNITRSSENDGTVVDVSSSNVQPFKTLTFVLAFNSGTFVLGPEIAHEKSMEKVKHIVMLVSATIPPIVAVLFMTNRWRKFGNDPKGRGVIVPQYAPPKGFDVLNSDFMLNERMSQKAFSAAIIELAVKRYINIYETKQKLALRRDKTDYELQQIRSADDLSQALQKAIDLIFKDIQMGERVKLSDFKSKAVNIQLELHALESFMAKDLNKRGYFAKDPKKVKTGYLTWALLYFIVGIGLLFLASVLGGWIGGLAVGLLLVAIVIFGFSFVMSAKTEAGVQVHDDLIGLKDYIKLAEADRLNYLQSPEGAERIDDPDAFDPKTPSQKIKLFEKLLPYAILFGQEKNWARQFNDLYTKPPDWYSGNWTAFNAAYLASSLGSFSSYTNTTFAAPSSSSGSGFSGGAGGGGGGGGGGGW